MTQQPSKTIAVVGCGNIGSRLLQSAAGVELDSLTVYGVEPYEAARTLSAERFAQIERADVGTPHTLEMVSSADALPATIDLLIIACSAHQRMEALKSALSVTQPETIILEKVLFTRLSDYDVAETLLEGTPCWVNTTRNVWPGYVALKDTLSDQPLQLSVSGSDWNLASNGIHFLSLIEMLSNAVITDLSIEDAQARDAKRADYRDMTGTLIATLDDGSTARLESGRDMNRPVSVTLRQGDTFYDIQESGGQINEQPFRMLHASQLSAPFKQILTEKRCGLPTLSQSARLHRLYLKALHPHIHGTDTSSDLCMIT